MQIGCATCDDSADVIGELLGEDAGEFTAFAIAKEQSLFWVDIEF